VLFEGELIKNVIEIRGNSKRKLKGYFHSNNLRINLFKKRILILSLLFLFFLSSTIIDSTQIINEQTEEKLTLIDEHLKLSNQEDDIFKLIYGMMWGPSDLDPHKAWDSTSYDVIYQVFEGLYRNNLSDPQFSHIPNLATADGTWEGSNYTVPLRSGVYFHDGTKFNATAVKFSFDRLAYFMNITGTLPSGENFPSFQSLYRLPDWTPIINKTEIVDEYTIKFVLNQVYAPFQSLLTFSGSFILSPTSTNATEYIDLNTGNFVGTGPFVYDHYFPSDEVKFHGYDNYWAGNPNISILEFSIFEDAQSMNYALLSGEIDFLLSPMASMYDTFEADSNIIIRQEGTTSAEYFLAMNNERINVTFRKAISYAINYSHIIEVLCSNDSIRLKSPVPENILYANWSYDVATYNVTRAREFMQSMGFGTELDLYNDAEWEAVADGVSPFGEWNYSYNIDNQFRTDLGVLLEDNLAKIGIHIVDDGMSWQDFLYRMYGYMEPGGYDSLMLFWTGWGPDYNEPSNLINTLLSNSSTNQNSAQYNGYLTAIEAGRDPMVLMDNVQLLMEVAVLETDHNQRQIYYNRIQELLVEEDMPWAFGYAPLDYDAYRSHFLGYQSNPIGGVRFFGVYQNTSIAPKNIFIEGNQEWTYLKNLGRCTGQGTYSDPYVLKDLVIDGQNKPVSCIRIKDSDVFFRIENCTFYNSTQAGIEFRNVSNSLITYNNCTNNNYGIYINSNFNVNITANLIKNNNIYGITLNDTSNDLIFNNTFTNNYINAQDNGTNNQWNNGIIGNIWDDYIGIDRNDDGIGDSPYLISGTASSQDNFPILEDGDDIPIITINSPYSNQVFGYPSPSYNVFIFAADKNSTWYTIDDGVTNFTFITNGTIDQGAWDLKPNGTVKITFYINDTTGNLGSDEVIFRKDIDNPQININSPYSNQVFGYPSPNYNVSIFGADIDSTWYTIDDGANNFTFITNDTIDQGAWALRPNGTVKITFYINDTTGNLGYDEVIIIRDVETPQIIVNSPTSSEYFAYSAPAFNLSILEGNIDTMWYTIDDGLTNITFTGFSGSINQSEWDKKGSGTIIIRFYANDTAGNLGFEGVIVNKDVEVPQITIYSPASSETFANFAPAFSLNILEANLDTMWYTIDGGITNIPFIGFSGSIDQSEWDKKGSGTIIIRFYANDTAGNLGFSSVSVQKSLAYWKLNPFIIDDTGLGDYTWAQAALQGWCGGSGTWNNPYIIENVIINGENSGSCIEIRNSNVPFIIRNSIMSYSGSGDFDAGIKLNNVSNCLLYNINGSSNNNFGVILIDCLNNTITESTINDNGVGGILLHYSNNNSIIDNTQTIHNNVKYGILLNSSFYNIIHNNYISYCQYGIYFYNSSENQIIYNIFVGNDVSHEESADSGDNIYEHNDDDTIPSDGDPLFPPDLLIIIAIIAIAAITSITIVVVLKKKISQRTGTKLKRKMDKNEATIRNKLQKKMSFVDDLIKENKIDIALKNLEKVRKKADASDFNAIFNKANERITHCNKLQREPGYKVEPESVVTPVVTSIATTAVAPVIKTKEKGKFTVFLSYSTLDSNYFQIPEIVKDLEKYPDIEKVLIWEKDSSQNIVEFMEDTLSKSDVFVLFCSDNSMKSPAVKDEWQSAFQMRKKDLLKIIPVYDKEDHIPYLLWQLLNIQYTKDDFQGFIEKLHNEILRE